ncbi:hypothetical protein V474_13280 [Novosphingobium barchaimii LL02]|uniref:Uncharacterized protein n=1 Tax=Novosphingobium barchaimii LL02 TaxID=1114963 RepID=A0A0J7XWM7_9SPHN|nr:hypothetical protein [Novosphingobium barchaimii]KMS55989.1 hypothetical protein V474_13280 [Novosphingobium barchaimii LL02]
MGWLKLLAMGGLGYAIFKYAAKGDREFAGGPACRDIRDAGPENMSAPPSSWNKVDEASDESFPASDPSSTY